MVESAAEVPQIAPNDMMRLRAAGIARGYNPRLFRLHIYTPALAQLFADTVSTADKLQLLRGDVFPISTDLFDIERIYGMPVVFYREGEFGGWQGNALALEVVDRQVFFTLYDEQTVMTWSLTRSIPKPPPDSEVIPRQRRIT